jgi:hypothetical protein
MMGILESLNRLQLICRTLIAAMLTVAAAPHAFAISSLPPSKTCKVLFANSITIHGVVRDVTPDVDTVNDPEGIDGWRYGIDVLKVYRGRPTGNRIIVKSENTTARLVLEPSKDYLIFASETAEPGVYAAWNNGDGVQGTDGEPFTHMRAREIDDALRATRSTVEGEVRDEDWRVLAAVPIEVVGHGTKRTIKTDSEGRFRLEVSPGRYDIHFPATFRETDYSGYGVPRNSIVLVAGQCAQIQLQRKRERSAR